MKWYDSERISRSEMQVFLQALRPGVSNKFIFDIFDRMEEREVLPLLHT
jgi:hypothetical protein